MEDLFSYKKYQKSDDIRYKLITKKGLDKNIVKTISEIKEEPEWMAALRLKAYEVFMKKPMPKWGPDLSSIDFDDLHYYASPVDGKTDVWEDVPEEIKKTFDRIGVSEAERKFLGGSTAQYDSEVVYHNLKKEWEDLGVVFLDMDSGLKEYPEIVKKYFGTVVPVTDNKFAALNSAVWSGGSFIYVPAGVEVKIPLQAYFRINVRDVGQFERTMIIAEEGSKVSYIEGCSAPIYSSGSLHSAVVEIIAKRNSYIRYTTIQNWSDNVYNLVTKRSHAYDNAAVEWIDGNIGSRITMKYPAIILKGEGARGEVISVAYAGKGQIQDTGAKIIHQASNTTSRIISKGIVQNGGKSAYRGLVKVLNGAKNCKAFVQCDAYLLDEESVSDTYPTIEIDDDSTTIGHEAKVGKIADDKLFYLMSRGFPEKEAMKMVVLGFMETFTRELPMEYAIELNRLVEMQLEGAVG
ncbi:Fe-S cluster assembly protein SufB [Candidatus Micrarchaeota archaeon]|nr:Fe-S cluster assembly protein SufB [Candidatus Micrarchaeota archaeon]